MFENSSICTLKTVQFSWCETHKNRFLKTISLSSMNLWIRLQVSCEKVSSGPFPIPPQREPVALPVGTCYCCLSPKCCLQFWFLLGGNVPLCSPRETVDYGAKKEGAESKPTRGSVLPSESGHQLIWLGGGSRGNFSWLYRLLPIAPPWPCTSSSEAWFFPFYFPFCKLLPSPQTASLLKLASLGFCYPQPETHSFPQASPKGMLFSQKREAL